MSITDEIIELTKQLVGFETIKSKPDELRNCVEFVKKYFADTGLVIQEFEKNAKPSLLIGFEKTLTPQLLLLGHLDVVEGAKEQFTAVERDGKLYGRGCGDMKGQDAVLMVLMKKLVESGVKKNVMLGLTTDEEIGGFDGVKLLVDKGVRPEIVLAPDAGKNMSIVTKEKGILHLTLRFTGKSSHGSRPWNGENAIDKAIAAYQKIRERFPDTTPENRWMNTCNIGIFKGGEAHNKVPDWAEISLDFRYVGDTTEEELLKMVRDITPAKITLESSGAPLDTDDDNPWVLKFRECSKEVLGKPLEISREHGASDIRHLADVGVPGFLCEVPNGGIHGLKEYLEIDKIEPYYQILEKFVLTHVDTL